MQRNINLRGHEVFTFQWSKRGEPLVILHGGLSHSEKTKKYLLPALKRNFKVFAYDRTGHGRTANQKGSFHFNFQTKELIAFLEDVVQEPAHLIGISDGANIALMAAIARPELIRSVVSIGGNTTASQIRMKFGKPEVSAESQAEHDRISPDHPSELIKKVTTAFKVWKSEPSIAITKLAKSTQSSDGSTLYVTVSPCFECSKLIIQAGVKRLVFKEVYRKPESLKFLFDAGIEIVRLEKTF